MAVFEHTALETRLEAQKLKSLPAISLVANQFIEACADGEIAIERLAHIIEKDPALLARIIGVANSAFYSPPEPVATAEEAVFHVLGVEMARNLALGIVLSGPFDTEQCPHFPEGIFWLESILTATLAHDLAPLLKTTEKVAPGDAYLGGLLHSFGLLVLVHLYPDDMNTIIGKSDTCCGSMELIADERDGLQTDHLEVGAWVGRKWHLPENTVLVMENLLNRDYRGVAWPLVQLTNFASRWASVIIGEEADPERPETAELLSLGIEEDVAEEVMEKVCTQLDDLRLLTREFCRG